MSWTGIFSKFGNFARATANKGADNLLKSDPVAVLKLENEEDSEAIRDTRPKMDEAVGQLNKLGRQLKDEENEISDINANIDAALQEEARLNKKLTDASDPEAIKAITIERDAYINGAQALQNKLDQRQSAHEITTKTYTQTNAFVTRAKAEVQQAVGRMADRNKRAADLGQQLQLSETVKSANQVAQGITNLNLSNRGGTSKAEEAVQTMIDTNMASLDNNDIYTPAADPTEKALETLNQKLATNKASSSLQERRKKLGLTT